VTTKSAAMLNHEAQYTQLESFPVYYTVCVLLSTQNTIGKVDSSAQKEG